jgi:tetratricopeptide (TPR) repeat protein
MKRLLLALAALCLAAPLWATAAGNEHLLREADRAYREGHYQAAFDSYHQLLRAEGATGHLLYNLGNAAFRLNQTGRAILYYERARTLLPRDADLRFNLGHVREQVRDDIPESEGLVRAAFFWLDSVTLPELFWCFAAANLLFWGVLAARLFSRAEWTSSLLFLLLALWVLAGSSFGLKWQQARTDDRAVVLQTEVSVFAGPDSRDTVLFKLHEGAIVRVERTEEGWSLARLPDGRRGWLRGEAVEKIAP